MRLIDADELINQGYEVVVDGWQYDTCNKSIDIDNIPTAYDIDKVVDELEIERKTANDTYNLFNMNVDLGRVFGLEKAIEIVKQGGVSDDVCEWIKYDYRTICPKNHDANNPYWRIPDNTDKLKYCPYCGKKIKVVEQNDN